MYRSERHFGLDDRAAASLRRAQAQPVDYVPDRPAILPQSTGAWLFCGLVFVFDVAPLIYIYLQVRGKA